jgi:hypothetical protein
LSEEFDVYGGTDTVARARKWALEGRYLLCGGVSECAHGFYLMDSCPGECRKIARLDHVNLWVPSDISEDTDRRAFLLYHPYIKTPGEATDAYARAHGLELVTSLPGDDWYGNGTLAIRLAIPSRPPLWPLEWDARGLLDNIGFWWVEEEEVGPME